MVSRLMVPPVLRRISIIWGSMKADAKRRSSQCTAKVRLNSSDSKSMSPPPMRCSALSSSPSRATRSWGQLPWCCTRAQVK